MSNKRLGVFVGKWNMEGQQYEDDLYARKRTEASGDWAYLASVGRPAIARSKAGSR